MRRAIAFSDIYLQEVAMLHMYIPLIPIFLFSVSGFFQVFFSSLFFPVSQSKKDQDVIRNTKGNFKAKIILSE